MAETLENMLADVKEDQPLPADLVRAYRDLICGSNIPTETIPRFCARCPTLYRMMTSPNRDLSMLDTFISRLDDLNKGRDDLGSIEKRLAHALNDRFVTPEVLKYQSPPGAE